MTTEYRAGDWNGQELVSTITFQAQINMDEEIKCIAHHSENIDSVVQDTVILNVTCKYYSRTTVIILRRSLSELEI